MDEAHTQNKGAFGLDDPNDANSSSETEMIDEPMVKQVGQVPDDLSIAVFYDVQCVPGSKDLGASSPGRPRYPRRFCCMTL